MTDHSSRPQPGKRNLGRGLAALFGEEEGDSARRDRENIAQKIPVGNLRPGTFQPRRNFNEEQLRALVDSVREKGVLQPLLVRRLGSGEQFEIIAGERRWRAAQLAKVHDVPVVELELSDAEALEVALVENIQRQDLTPVEEADGYKRLMDEFSHTQDALARAVGKSRSHIANMLRLLNLPDQVKQMLDDGSLSAGHGRALLAAADPLALARDVLRRGLSVRETENIVARAKSGGGKRRAKQHQATAPKDADTLALERDLSDALGLRVTLTLKGEAGTLAVNFRSLEQLDDIAARLRRPAQGFDRL